MRLLPKLWLGLLVALLSQPAYTQQAAPTSTEALTTAAETGNVEAQYALAERYQNGDGVLQNYGKAVAWYTRAAEAGFAPAENQLGRFFHAGLGVEKDQAQAVHWLEKAALQGDPQFLFDLARALETGADGSTDPVRAATLYEQAANAGHMDAMVSLGVLYQDGRGVDQDYTRALELYQGPAATGHARAQNNLGLLYVRGTGVEQDYDRAFALFNTAANQGLPVAMTNLGVMYENGFGTDHSDEIAAELYRRAGQSNQTDAATLDAFIFDQRLATPKTTQEDLNQLARSAGNGDPVAQFLLGWLIVSQDTQAASAYTEAARFFRAAAEKGHNASMANLGLLYFYGRGVPQDYVLGQMWLVLADSAGLDGAASLAAGFLDKMTPDQINEAQTRAAARWETIQGGEYR